MIIAITGTPGTGKSTLAKKLAEHLKFKHVDVTELARSYKDKKDSFVEGVDKKRDSMIIDPDKLEEFLKVHIKNKGLEDVIVDSHLSHLLSKDFVDIVLITRCEISLLKKRLSARDYYEDKVKENIESEIFEICKSEAQELNHNIMEVDTTKDPDIEKIIHFVDIYKNAPVY